MDKSLLLRADASAVPTCPLYYMLETVRAYAALELAAAGDREEAMRGLVRYCINEAASVASGMLGPEQVDALDRAREDLDSYRAALTWLIAHDRASDATRIASSLMFFWAIRGHAAEGLQWYEQILELPSLSPAEEAALRAATAVMHYTLGHLENTRRAVERTLALAATTRERWIVAHSHNLLGHVEYSAGHLEAARASFTRSLDAFRALGVPSGIGNTLTGLAGVALTEGEVTQAEELLDEATAVLRDGAPGSDRWRSMFAPSLRCAAANRRKRSPTFAKALRAAGGCRTSMRMCTGSYRSRPRRGSKAMTCGRRAFWALATPSPSAPG
jgi:tetratricopeptide (TPR) repeat protein